MIKVRQFALFGALLTGVAFIAAPSTAQDKKAEWVTVKGQVIMTKEFKPGIEAVNVDQAVCEKNGKLIKSVLKINEKNKGVENVIVFIRPDSTDRKELFPKEKAKPELMKVPAKTHVIDQPCCQFEPRVLAVRVGDGLEVKNSSTIPHNIKYDGENPFNVTIPAAMSHKMAIPFVAQNTPIPFSCSIHPWMAGRIRVFDHPYFTITDKDGKFEIKDLPPGKWRIVYQHELGFHKGKEGIIGFPIEAKGATTELKAIDLELP